MTRAERATQIWAVLAWAATHRQNITYPQLARVTGAFTGGLGDLLEPIQAYCINKEIPPLTILAVQTKSGLPGAGFHGASAERFASEQARVFAFDWLEHGNPGVEKLEDASIHQASNPSKDI
jgi:hypothetical protein